MDKEEMKVLVACEFSQVVTKSFRDKDHEAYSCDLLPTEGNSKWHIQGDVLDHLADGWDLMIAHPDCRYLCVTGNKWMKEELDTMHERLYDRDDAIQFFMRLANAPIPKICIENPVGIMSKEWRKPNQIIQPFQFGHKEPKKTCLWLKNLPKLIPTKIVKPEYFKSKSGKNMANWYYLSKLKGKERQQLRERTFQGIADAMADQWSETPIQMTLGGNNA